MKFRIFIFLVLFVFVGALQQQLVVDVSFTETADARIIDYERFEGEDPNRRFGSWTLQLRDQNLIVSQTQFSPLIIDGQGNTEYLEEVSVPILAPSGARSIELVDADGVIVDAYPITGTCGDALCEIRERGTCSLDCAPQAVSTYTEVNQEPLEAVGPQRGFGFWALIGGIVLVIIVLILVLIHVNRKKENPVQTQSQYY
jgi:hypothetical protein